MDPREVTIEINGPIIDPDRLESSISEVIEEMRRPPLKTEEQLLSAAYDALSNNEREILRLVAFGYTNAAIAMKLGYGEMRISTYISQIYAVLGLRGTNSEVNPRVVAANIYLRVTMKRE